MLARVRTQLATPKRSTPTANSFGRHGGGVHPLVPAVAPADDADAIAVDPAGGGQHALAGDAVAEVGVAVLAVGHAKERPAVAAAAAVVDLVDGVAVVDQELDQ